MSTRSHILTPAQLSALTTAKRSRRRRRIRVKAHVRSVPRSALLPRYLFDARWLEIERRLLALARMVDSNGSLVPNDRSHAQRAITLIEDLFLSE